MMDCMVTLTDFGVACFDTDCTLRGCVLLGLDAWCYATTTLSESGAGQPRPQKQAGSIHPPAPGGNGTRIDTRNLLLKRELAGFWRGHPERACRGF